MEERGGMTAADEEPLAAAALEEAGGKAAVPGQFWPHLLEWPLARTFGMDLWDL